MRVWTMQPIEVWEQLERDGTFCCDEKFAENAKDFKDSYAWLIEQMDKRINHPSECNLPIWAWYRYDWVNKKPDLRHTGFGYKGEKSVCIELEVPDNEVLLSDFNAWHYVLNSCWYDDSKNEEEWEQLHDWFDNLPGEEREKLRIESWQKIFNIEPVRSEWASNGRFVQAVFWEIKKEYIKKVQFFTAR